MVEIKEFIIEKEIGIGIIWKIKALRCINRKIKIIKNRIRKIRWNEALIIKEETKNIKIIRII